MHPKAVLNAVMTVSLVKCFAAAVHLETAGAMPTGPVVHLSSATNSKAVDTITTDVNMTPAPTINTGIESTPPESTASIHVDTPAGSAGLSGAGLSPGQLTGIIIGSIVAVGIMATIAKRYGTNRGGNTQNHTTSIPLTTFGVQSGG